ncbi:MAG TPA: transcription antitermination factor NusB [Candidatus Paceibacterota bacterium]
MAHRHLSRGIVLQALFEWDFNSPNVGAKKSDINAILERNINEYGEGGSEKEFIAKLTKGVIAKRDTLDAIISKAARDWPLLQTPLVDRNVLRIGLYELLYSNHEEVPARVAINEAIELAKSYGGERSGKFINGVLGTVYKEMGEPGKNDEPKKKRKYKKKEELTKEEKESLPLKKLVGAVVYHKDKSGTYQLALVHDVFGYWTLSKGKVGDEGNEGENEEQAVVREIKEEMNLVIMPRVQLGVNEYIATNPVEGNIRKRVTYFLAEAQNPDSIKLEEEKGGLDDTKWFNLSVISDLKIYPDVRPIIDKGVAELNGKSREKN